jgi:glycosyltransferase involved in cell wall biosynthesis
LREGETGWAFDPRAAHDFAAALGRALDCPDRERLGALARGHVERFGPDAMADGMRRAIAAAAERERGPA